MSTVTISVSVSCLPVSGSAAEQVSLETRLKRLQRLKISDLFWQPVPCQWCKDGERTFSEICLSPDNDEVNINVLILKSAGSDSIGLGSVPVKMSDSDEKAITALCTNAHNKQKLLCRRAHRY